MRRGGAAVEQGRSPVPRSKSPEQLVPAANVPCVILAIANFRMELPAEKRKRQFLSFPELRWKRQLTDLRVRRIPFDSANEFFHLKL
jgi:hypothetical protein